MKKEIMPLGMNLFIQPYEENPYAKKVTDGGLQLIDGDFKNPDSGENEKLNQEIRCAKVLEVGPECKYVKPGDDVFFRMSITIPIPFMGQGFFMTNEPNILSVINDDLSTRFN